MYNTKLVSGICIHQRFICREIREMFYSHSFIHPSLALQPFLGSWPLLQFHNLFYTDDRLLIRLISPSQGRYLHTEKHKHRINTYTDIHALSRFRTHDTSVRASEDSSCLRPLQKK
jgi:hypothetical protein